MKQNNFKIIGLLLTIFILILPQQTYAAVDVTPDRAVYKEIVFDEPKTVKKTYNVEVGVRFRNTDNVSSATFTKPTWSPASGWDARIKHEISCGNTTTIPPDSSKRCKVTFKIPYDTPEKEYKGTITANGKSIPVTLKVEWPPPDIAVKSFDYNFGKLKAGKTEARKITIVEMNGYKGTSLLSFEINVKEFNESGVKASLDKNYIADFPAGGTGDISLSVEVPQRGLKPGNYTGYFEMRYTDESKGMHELPSTIFKFEISYPKLGLGNNTFTFPDLGIPYQGSRELAINEVAGFIGIEGIRFDIEKAYNIYEGDEKEYLDGISWITFDPVDFVPAGGSTKVNVYVNVPESAAIGQYRWEGKITTTYAGSSDISILGMAALPGCPEIKQKLVGMASLSVVKKNANAESLRIETLTVLEESECIRGLSDVLTGSAAVETLLVSMDEVNTRYNENKVMEAYKQLVSARTEVDMLDGVSTTYPDYEDNIDNMKVSANGLWDNYANLIIEKLEKEAEESQYTNPGLCSENYDKISLLYTKMGDTKKALLYSDKSTKCRQDVDVTKKKAEELEKKADDLYMLANTKIFTISEYKVVALIFNYPGVDDKFNESITRYEEALKLWNIIDKPRDAARVMEKVDKLKDEKEMLKKTAVIYIAILVLIILFSFIRFSRASVNYNRDTLEADLSRVVAEQKS